MPARIGVFVAVLACTIAASAAPAGAGGPSAYRAALRVYEQQGTVPACEFSARELQAALNGVDTYGAQYFADFTQAIQAALSARAAGACPGPRGSTTRRSQAAGTAPAPRAHFGPVTAATSAGVPAPLAVLGGLALALALFGAWAGLTRARRRG